MDEKTLKVRTTQAFLDQLSRLETITGVDSGRIIRMAIIHESKLIEAYNNGARVIIENPDGSRKEMLHGYTAIKNGYAEGHSV